MINSFLRILDGGRRLDIADANKHFISAYVTDTRLMGVLAVYAHWHLDNAGSDVSGKGNGGSDVSGKGNGDPDKTRSKGDGHDHDLSDDPFNLVWGDLHQFFYIDCEEAGLETYQEVRSSDLDKVEKAEQKLLGGLGADKIELDESRLRQLLSMWRDFNLERGLPLPEKKDHYDFIFSEEPVSDPDGKLMAYICPRIGTDLQLVNYFLMRCFGRDHVGAAYLTADDAQVAIDTYDRYEAATFCRNVTDERAQRADGSREYLCESIVEMHGRYDRIISQVTVRDLKVRELICRSISPITHSEAAMIMKKSEFINIYEVLMSDDELESNIDEFTVNFHTTVTEYENGRLFLSYRPNNDHVNRRVFQLSDDVRGMFFLSDNGQLIASAYSEKDMTYLESMMRDNVLAPYLSMTGRYEFQTPVLYEFMQGDFDSFEEFILALKGERP